MPRPGRLTTSLTSAVVCVSGLALAGCSSSSTTAASSSSSPVSCSGTAAPAFSGKVTAYDAPANIVPDGSVGAQVATPVLTTSNSGTPGYAVARLDVNAQILTNGVFAMTPGSFVLSDASGKTCAQPSINPLPNAFPAMQVDEAHPGTGSVAFLVPTGADLSKYTVSYVDATKKTLARWSAAGVASTNARKTSCDGAPAKLSYTGVPSHPFGTPGTIGDSTVSLTLTPGKPTSFDFKPSDKQPNNVVGIKVSLKASAKGALGFVDRDQFRLVDAAGNFCRYNQLGSEGETLSSDNVEPGKDKTYTLVFWIPKGATSWRYYLVYLPDTTKLTVTQLWRTDVDAKGRLQKPPPATK